MALALAAGAWAPVYARTAMPGADSATYRLVEVAGTPLPAPVEQDRGCRGEVTAGTLRLGGDGRWELETTKRGVCGDRTDTETDTDDGRYAVEGQTVRFRDDGRQDHDRDSDDGDIDLDDVETGTLGADGMLTVQLDDGRTTLLFRR